MVGIRNGQNAGKDPEFVKGLCVFDDKIRIHLNVLNQNMN